MGTVPRPVDIVADPELGKEAPEQAVGAKRETEGIRQRRREEETGPAPVPRQNLVRLWNQGLAHTGRFSVPLLKSRLPGHDLDPG